MGFGRTDEDIPGGPEFIRVGYAECQIVWAPDDNMVCMYFPWYMLKLITARLKTFLSEITGKEGKKARRRSKIQSSVKVPNR